MNPCLNIALCSGNGVCTANNSYTGYTCTCNPGYTGINCNATINNCLSNPCINNGTCYSFINSYNCYCPLGKFLYTLTFTTVSYVTLIQLIGFNGLNCQQQINYCSSSPCVHGSCNSLPGDYVCMVKIQILKKLKKSILK